MESIEKKEGEEVITTAEIENLLYKFFQGNIATIERMQNLSTKTKWNEKYGIWMHGYAISHETDILTVSKDYYATEVEIKRSISDLKADFKKEHAHKSEAIRNFYYCFPDELLEKALPIIPEECGVLIVTKRAYSDSLEIKKYRKCKPNREARKLTQEEVAEIWRLCAIRYWNYRKI